MHPMIALRVLESMPTWRKLQTSLGWRLHAVAYPVAMATDPATASNVAKFIAEYDARDQVVA